MNIQHQTSPDFHLHPQIIWVSGVINTPLCCNLNGSILFKLLLTWFLCDAFRAFDISQPWLWCCVHCAIQLYQAWWAECQGQFPRNIPLNAGWKWMMWQKKGSDWQCKICDPLDQSLRNSQFSFCRFPERQWLYGQAVCVLLSRSLYCIMYLGEYCMRRCCLRWWWGCYHHRSVSICLSSICRVMKWKCLVPS